MALLATLDEPRFRVERWEIDRPGQSFAIDTLRQAQQAMPGAELLWVIGADAMALIHTWHEARHLFDLTRFLVISREGLDESALRRGLAITAPWAPPEGLSYLPMSPVNISSTGLRRGLAAGQDVSAGLPGPVATYIERYGLYRAPQEVSS